MSDKDKYIDMQYKLNRIVDNINDFVYYVDQLDGVGHCALNLNDNAYYTDSIVNMKYSLQDQSYMIRNEILYEIEEKISS